MVLGHVPLAVPWQFLEGSPPTRTGTHLNSFPGQCHVPSWSVLLTASELHGNKRRPFPAAFFCFGHHSECQARCPQWQKRFLLSSGPGKPHWGTQHGRRLLRFFSLLEGGCLSLCLTWYLFIEPSSSPGGQTKWPPTGDPLFPSVTSVGQREIAPLNSSQHQWQVTTSGNAPVDEMAWTSRMFF